MLVLAYSVLQVAYARNQWQNIRMMDHPLLRDFHANLVTIAPLALRIPWQTLAQLISTPIEQIWHLLVNVLDVHKDFGVHKERLFSDRLVRTYLT